MANGNTPEELLPLFQDLREDESGDECEIINNGDSLSVAGSVEESEHEYDDERSDTKSSDTPQWTEILPKLRTSQEPQTSYVEGGPTPYATHGVVSGSPLSSFFLLFCPNIMTILLEYTIIHGKTQDPNWDLSDDELKKFIGLLLARGFLGWSKLTVSTFWDRNWGCPIFTKSMAREKFRQIMQHLRLDDKKTRNQRLVTDKFALASEVWEKFVTNCRDCYIPNQNVSVEEQIYPAKVRCPFLQYMPSKPVKFGIKYYILSDVRTKFCLNAFPYLGSREDCSPNQSMGEHIMLKLLKPYFNSGLSVTTNDYFLTPRLINELRHVNISVVGPVRITRKYLPRSVKEKEELYSTQIFKSSDGTFLTSYQAKKDKKIVLLSSLPENIYISPKSKKTPETVIFYKETQTGVDSLLKTHSTRAPSRRWPIHVLYNILDIACFNSWILYKEVTNEKIARRKFIQQLVMELTGHYDEPEPPVLPVITEDERPAKRRKCQTAKCGNKSRNVCDKCNKVYCGKCTKKFTTCSKCL